MSFMNEFARERLTDGPLAMVLPGFDSLRSQLIDLGGEDISATITFVGEKDITPGDLLPEITLTLRRAK